MPSNIQIKVARIVEFGEPLVVGLAPKPIPGPRDVLVRVGACSLVRLSCSPSVLIEAELTSSRLRRLKGPGIKDIISGYAPMPMQDLPAIFGLDVAGVIEAVGEYVLHHKVGDRVYVNPSLSCVACPMCRKGRRDLCPSNCLRGYFAIGPLGKALLDQYPYGGLSQYVVSPDSKIALLPESISLETASRLGYAGTSYAALKKADVGPGKTVLINGVTGSLGVAAVAIALGLGASKILGIGRSTERLAQVMALAPKDSSRVQTYRSINSEGPEKAARWAAEQTASGEGVDAIIDCLGTGGPAKLTEALLRQAVRPGGKVVLLADATEGDISQSYSSWFTRDVAVLGSNFFYDGEIDELIGLVDAGVVNLSWLETKAFALDKVNEAVESVAGNLGGFVNVVVVPDDAPQ